MSYSGRISTFIFAGAIAVSLVISSPSANAITTTFDQISWGDGSGGYEDQNSQWGEANVSFDAGDVGSLGAFGSGYMGWVNVVTSVAGGSNNNWSVQNEPVIFDHPGDLTSGLAMSFHFDLGQTDGAAVGNLNYSLTLTSSPLTLQPTGPLSLVGVGVNNEVEGTSTDPTGEGDEAGTPAQDSIGAGVAGAAAGVVAALAGRGNIQTAVTNVAAVNEAVNGCAPGAAARSIAYLGKMYPSLSVTQSAQQIYGTLTNLMSTTKTGGTKIANFVAGKNQYFVTNGLAIAPTVVTTNFAAAISALNSTGDVELGVSWGPGKGGHAVFVTGITTLFTNGVPYRYVVDVIQDPSQGSGSTTNGTDRYTFDTSGNMLNRGAGASINSFRIEMVTVPEPASLVLLGTGICLLACWGRSRRIS